MSTTLTAPPAPQGSPATLRGYANSLRELATTLRTIAGTASTPLPPTWRGAAPVAAAATAARLAAEFRTAAGAVDDMAAHLESYATKLATAAEHHHHWLKRACEVAGVVLVTAAVVTITVATVGAAAPVAAGVAIEAEAGATAAVGTGAGAAAGAGAVAGAGAETGAAGAVAGMETAAAQAAAAENSLVGSLGARTLPQLRRLAAFVRPQLVGAEVNAGFDAATHVGEHGSLSPYSVALDLLENIAIGGGVGVASRRWLTKPGLALRIGRVINPAAAGPDARPTLIRHLSAATTNAGVDLTENEVTGKHDSAGDVGLDFLQGLVGSGAGDLAAAHDVKVARGLNRIRNLQLPVLRVDEMGRVVNGHIGAVYRIDPNVLQFSQNSINRTELRVIALSAGWNGEPISVIPMPDGSLTSLDNRRVMAARKLGIQANVRLLDPAGVVPPELLADRFDKYKLPAGSTWLDVVHARIADQGRWKVAHPHGRLALPDKVSAGAVQIVGIRPPRKVTLVASAPATR